MYSTAGDPITVKDVYCWRDDTVSRHGRDVSWSCIQPATREVTVSHDNYTVWVPVCERHAELYDGHPSQPVAKDGVSCRSLVH